MNNNAQSFLQRVKEKVDHIYETVCDARFEGDGWYHGGFSKMDGLTARVSRELIGRNILIKERDTERPRLAFKYMWKADMSPTDTLYRNVASVLSSVKEENEKEVSAPVNPLAKFSTETIWSEIKRRGVRIMDNHLVLILE